MKTNQKIFESQIIKDDGVTGNVMMMQEILHALKQHTAHYLTDIIYEILAVHEKIRDHIAYSEETELHCIGIRDCGVDSGALLRARRDNSIYGESPYAGGIFTITMEAAPLMESVVIIRVYKEVL